MKTSFFTGRVVTFLAVIAAMLTLSARADLQVGDKPEFALTTLDNQRVTSQQLRGRVAIVELWATWCGPCVAQLPHMKKLYREYQPKGVVLIGVSWDKQAATVRSFIKENDMPWPQALDADQSPRLGTAWAVNGIPHAFIFSPAGELLWRGHPANIDKPLEDAVKNHPMLSPQQVALVEQAAKLQDLREQLQSASPGAVVDSDDADQDDPSATTQPTMDKLVTESLDALAAVPDDMLATRPVRDQATALQQLIDQLAQQHVAVARAINEHAKGQAVLTLIRNDFKAPAAPRSTTAASPVRSRDASQAVVDLAARRLALADELDRNGKPEYAYKHYQWIVQQHLEGPVGEAAAAKLAAYQADVEIMATIAMRERDTRCQSLISMAQSYQKAGQIDLAREQYQAVLNEYPDSAWAEQAAKAMADLN